MRFLGIRLHQDVPWRPINPEALMAFNEDRFAFAAMEENEITSVALPESKGHRHFEASSTVTFK